MKTNHASLVDFDNAIATIEKGLACLEKHGLGSSKEYADFLNLQLANVVGLGDSTKLFDLCQTMIDFYSGILTGEKDVDAGLRLKFADALIRLGALCAVGNQSQAIDVLMKAIEFLEVLDDNLAIIYKIKAYSTLSGALLNAKEFERLTSCINKVHSLIQEAQEMNYDESSYFESYYRLTVTEACFQLVSGDLKGSQALFRKIENEISEKREYLKETKYSNARFLLLRDQAVFLTTYGHFKQAINVYKKLTNVMFDSTDIKGVMLDLNTCLTCVSALDIVTTANMLNPSQFEEDEKLKKDTLALINNSKKAMKIAQEMFDVNPNNIGASLARANMQLIMLEDLTEDGIDSVFEYGKNAMYYANLLMPINPYFKYSAICPVCSLVIAKYCLEEDTLDKATKQKYNKEIAKYADQLFAICDSDFDELDSANPQAASEYKTTVALLAEHNQQLVEKLAEKYPDALSNLFGIDDE